mgnify:CR=1 FL=1
MNVKLSLSQLAAIYAVYKDLSPATRTVRCCTCGKSIHIEQIEDCYSVWGHYIPRSIARCLIYNPLNSHAQCIDCNLYADPKTMQLHYDDYMKYRYGSSVKELLFSENNQQTEEKYNSEYYMIELLKLSSKFPELAELLIQQDTGEIKEICSENSIEKQFNTYSRSFKDDLDVLCRTLQTDYIEYQRL